MSSVVTVEVEDDPLLAKNKAEKDVKSLDSCLSDEEEETPDVVVSTIM